ncbi:Ig-like domain-containing protein [Fibrobacter sp. UWB5]|uniref:Ig-like domain-containing protein n=1 Tax=Fibrobacter sp. UWB5 TaxID=1964360 RepID=UPI000B51E9D2|nr:Ig-like domain-containing protein [Fibrobacter sp. UWB5]
MMKKMISWMGVMGALVSSAYAASATVWSAEDGNGTVPPVGAWYKYPTKTTNGATATFVTDSIHGYKTLKASVSATNESSAAGMGFAWAKNEGEISLAAYKGVCLTYSATSQFRLEFKQSTISDYDYYGVVLNKSTAQKSVFIDFADLTQEGWGDAADFDLTAQQALQFAYKQSLAAETGNSTTNTIAISAVSLGNSCGGHAPELIATETEKDLNEGDTLKLDLSKVFADEDEDIVSYSVSIVSEKAGAVKLADSLYAKTGSVKLVTGANPSGSATVTVIAVDATKKSAGYVLTVTPVDRENAPVAVNDSYTTKEETKLVKSTLSLGVMLNDYDPDDDDFVPQLVSTTEHGELDFNEKTGGFTYTPAKDFFGADSFTYQLVESKADDPLTSNVAVVKIEVTNVNDPLTIAIVDSTISFGEAEYKLGDTLVVQEDFEPTTVIIPVANVAFVDPDFVGEAEAKVNVKSSGVIKVQYNKMGSNHLIDLLPIDNADGVSKVTMFAVDGKDTASVSFFVMVTPVADPPVALDDAYSVSAGTVAKIAAAEGVLKNDKNPDNAKSKLTAVLKDNAAAGKVTLAADGSFTYESTEAAEQDVFTYVVVNEEGDSSELAAVVLTIVQPPVFIEDSLPSITKRFANLKEEFSTKQIRILDLQDWFTDEKDKGKLTFTARSEDSLLNPVVNTTTKYFVLASVKNACGETNFILTAKNSRGGSVDVAIPVSIECVNDKPVLEKLLDTLYIGAGVWKDTIDLNDFVTDPDGDTLVFTITESKALAEKLSWEQEGNLFIAESKDSLAKGTVIKFDVKAADASTYVKYTLVLIADEAPKASIKLTIAAAPKMNWQSAILANRGAVALFDMQGRVMWKAKLPVSEADVRNAAAQVQGRKILQVNKQSWTIK